MKSVARAAAVNHFQLLGVISVGVVAEHIRTVHDNSHCAIKLLDALFLSLLLFSSELLEVQQLPLFAHSFKIYFNSI